MTQYQENAKQAWQNWTQALYETNKAIAQSVVAAQERNVKFAQQVYESGTEVLKNHAETTRSYLEQRPQDQQEAVQSLVNSFQTAQERNMRYAQDILNNGTEVLKEHADAVQGLMHTLTEHVREQQGAFSAQPLTDAYANLLDTPFAYYKQAIETTQALTQQALEVAQKSALQAVEVSQKMAQQAMQAAASANEARNN
jgi:hypothetical protein